VTAAPPDVLLSSAGGQPVGAPPPHGQPPAGDLEAIAVLDPGAAAEPAAAADSAEAPDPAAAPEAADPPEASEAGDSLDQLAAELGPGGALAPEREADAYRRRMDRRREVQRQRVQERNREKGLVLVFTGDGKGKTTAALGLVLRTLGHGERVAVVQYIKGGWHPGEARALALFGDALHWHALGEGFTWETQDRERDRELVQRAWERSLTYLADPDCRLVVLDEVNVALKLGYLSLESLLEGLAQRPPLTHVALTGRGAPQGLLERADLVTEMKLIRHPFREQGVKAQAGIEY
jgi:cob(I)alamin adenosyltransferase